MPGPGRLLRRSAAAAQPDSEQFRCRPRTLKATLDDAGSWPTTMVIQSPRRRVRIVTAKPELFIASAPYWIKVVYTAKYKIKPHTTAINTNQIAIFPNLGTCP
jgi:hypothetical protein